jgi:hypothetical protein
MSASVRTTVLHAANDPDPTTRLPLELDGLPGWVRERLATPPGVQQRTLYEVADGTDHLLAFGQRRPLAGQEKLFGLCGSPQLLPRLLAGVEAAVSAWGGVVVKVEAPGLGVDAEAVALAGLAETCGYAVLRPPIRAAVPVDATPVALGWARFLSSPTRAEVPYVRQSTGFTCGPASALMALAAQGLTSKLGRNAELNLWREATYVLGCDAFGLALAMARRGLTPSVLVDYPDTIVKPGGEPWESDMRDFMQRDFAARAQSSGLCVERRPVAMTELPDLIKAGSVVLALIDQAPMQAEPGGHWVLAYALAGDHVLVQDPWTATAHAETWVDAHALPLTPAALTDLAHFGDPPSRALVIAPAPTDPAVLP